HASLLTEVNDRSAVYHADSGTGAGVASAGGLGPYRRRRADDVVAESLGETVDDLREALASQGIRIEEGQLPGGPGPERGRGKADQPDRLIERLALEQRVRAAVELEPVLRRVGGHGAR